MTHAQEKHNKRKVVLIIATILVAIGIITGGISAFFSDFVTGNSTITAGTLDLVQGTDTITQNGTDITNIGNNNKIVENFNPGDVVTVSVPVTNSGSKSAYLRGKFELTGTAFTNASAAADFTKDFSVFKGTLTQAEAETQKGTTTDLAQDATNVTWDGTAKSLTWVDPTSEIINGNSAKADFETETGGADTRTLTYTIYFKKSGKNEWQDKTVALSYAAQAIQYRNNTTADWTDLTTTEVNP